MSSRAVSFRYFILGLLTQQSVSGYDIKRMLKSLGWLVGEPSFGSLYPALAALEEDGQVTMVLEARRNRPSRKVYSITEDGRQTVEDWISRPSGPNASLKAFAMRLILADNFTQAGLIAQLYQRRSQIAVQSAALEENATLKDDGVDSGQPLALEYGLALANAELAWLDTTLDRLSRKPQVMEVAQGS